MTARQASADISRIEAPSGSGTPAQFTSTSIAPNSDTQRSTSAPAPAKSATDSAHASAVPPLPPISAATASAARERPLASGVPFTITRAPAAASPSATSRPIPWLEPVTSAARPSSSRLNAAGSNGPKEDRLLRARHLLAHGLGKLVDPLLRQRQAFDAPTRVGRNGTERAFDLRVQRVETLLFAQRGVRPVRAREYVRDAAERQRHDRAVPGRQLEKTLAPGLVDHHRRARLHRDLYRAALHPVDGPLRAVGGDAVDHAGRAPHVLDDLVDDADRAPPPARRRSTAEHPVPGQLEHARDDCAR